MNLLIILKSTKTVERVAVVFIISRFLIFFYFVEKMGVVAIQKPEKAEEMRIFEYDFTVKYYPESDEAKVPYQVTPKAAGYDLYAAEINKCFTKI